LIYASFFFSAAISGRFTSCTSQLSESTGRCCTHLGF
jgi:hypothetical protein